MTVFAPIAVADLELSEPLVLRPDPPAIYSQVRALVRLEGMPVGQVSLQLADRTPSTLADSVWAQLGPQISAAAARQGHAQPSILTAEGLVSATEPPPPPGPPPATEPGVGSRTGRPSLAGRGQSRADGSGDAPRTRPGFGDVAVVIATRNRTAILQRCLTTIATQSVSPSQIIVVDNAPIDESTRELLTGPFGAAHGITYVREDRPGLGIAHNAALPHLRAEFAAFTDDDVLADQFWLEGLLDGFDTGTNVVCVTGMIVPAELETREQLWTEDYLGFTKGYEPRLFDLGQNRPESPLYPFAAGVLGSGANMAFRTSYLVRVGGFDDALGTGTMSRGGDDLAAFHEVIMNGHQLAYAPSAIIRHFHNKTYASIKRQMSGYGVGLTAYLASAVARRPGSLLTITRRAVGGVAHVVGPSSAKVQNLPTDYPSELVWAERWGMLIGPVSYARTRWERRGWRRPISPPSRVAARR